MIENHINTYIDKCKFQRKLSDKTIKAYRIDLQQFHKQVKFLDNKEALILYFSNLHTCYKPKTVKRKIASVKAFYHYLDFEEILVINPIHKIDTRFKEPLLLPKTIDNYDITKMLSFIYKENNCRDIAVIELLLCTGIRVSEVSNLEIENVNFETKTIRIYGKGNKERILSIDNTNLLQALKKYRDSITLDFPYFFCNRLQSQLSEQSIRGMIKKYARLSGITKNITPHMFRHTFATLLLEEDVDIRYIQNILGHSSITTTQIYTHVNNIKQREILTLKNPRNRFSITG